MPETREIFRNFPFLMQVIFYVVATGSMAVFAYGFFKRIQKYRRGRNAGRWNRLLSRKMKAIGVMITNRKIWKRDGFAGFAHTLVFWGFVFLFIGTVIVFIDHDVLRFMDIKLLEGPFYLWFSLVLDIFGLLFIVGLVLLMFRRGITKPPQLDYTRPDLKPEAYDRSGFQLDDKIFLWLLLLIGVTGFLIEGFRIAEDRPPFEVWSPVGWAIADLTDAAGWTASANTLHLYSWWIHAVLVMFFVAYIPFSKAMHMLIDFVNLMFTEENAAQRLPRVSEDEMKAGMGVHKIEDFTWKELLDFDACTKCGRCHVACPARASGTPLSPRDLILDLRTFADSSIGISEWFKQKFTVGSNGGEIAGSVIRQDTLWACTTCMACVEACPVGIEHLTSIVQMRRRLVDQGKMDDSLQEALMNIGDYGNSFGQPERARAKWTQGLDFKIKDVRKEEAEYLWFVGDYASYDVRMQELSRTVAQIFTQIGIDFGILYDGEKNAGNDVRRIGEEGLFEMLAEDNIATLKKSKFKEIVTTDPHSFNTIRNEYPEFGGRYTTWHYTGLLNKLLDEGKLKFSKKLNYRVTYHDPCYLGRYNGETEAPRRLLKALGLTLMEMPRCGANSFCCGAGGGRIWMDDSNVEERPSEQRIKEALSVGELDYFVVCCPKDYSMYTDAVKTSGNEDKIAVKDIIQLIQEAL